MRKYKTVRVEARVYERLKKYKAGCESFSEFLDKLLDIYELLLAVATDHRDANYARAQLFLYLN